MTPEVVDEYAAGLRGAGRSRTADEYRRYLRRWLRAGADTDGFLADAPSESSRTVRLAAIRGFVGFCVVTGRLDVAAASRLVKGWRV